MTSRSPIHRLLYRVAGGLAALACAGAAQALVVSADMSAFGGTTLITFDEPIAGPMLNTQYAGLGVLRFDAEVLGTSGSPMVLDHTLIGREAAVSGSRIGLMGASISFAAGVDRAGIWLYKTNGAQYLTALDAGQNVLLTLAVDAGSVDNAYYDFVGMQSDTKDIRYLVISNTSLAASPAWSTSGYTPIYDDLMFSPITPVPEPQTWALMLLCLALTAAVVRRR